MNYQFNLYKVIKQKIFCFIQIKIHQQFIICKIFQSKIDKYLFYKYFLIQYNNYIYQYNKYIYIYIYIYYIYIFIYYQTFQNYLIKKNIKYISSFINQKLLFLYPLFNQILLFLLFFIIIRKQLKIIFIRIYIYIFNQNFFNIQIFNVFKKYINFWWKWKFRFFKDFLLKKQHYFKNKGRCLISNLINNYRIANIDIKQNKQCSLNILINPNISTKEQLPLIKQQLQTFQKNNYDAIICIAGGWTSGSIKDERIFDTYDKMHICNILPSIMGKNINIQKQFIIKKKLLIQLQIYQKNQDYQYQLGQGGFQITLAVI
ncbi:hypothetical protein IMG5_156780 [Ichthyophthirius multifiliis]|uniref:Uncharacterized protein n=1 Tax=Ichthyophthirius multifiliis TaxID=5932 RepID=G0QZH1_ICHMU|nr:hypothetical protein IMG5_156780 [Ichthyophthirius multifiliis]EGR29381.1 hypothetical protein IMG5_156780 [Ichthyophthirius multifiliis]|eukprot:XP_004030617.1 hypothetical protein IMG5_156780 [Ichthyophthirius multifiliis]